MLDDNGNKRNWEGEAKLLTGSTDEQLKKQSPRFIRMVLLGLLDELRVSRASSRLLKSVLDGGY